MRALSKLQIIVLSLWPVLILALFLGFDTRSSEQQEDLASRATVGTQVDVQPIIMSAKESLADQDLQEIKILEGAVEASDDKTKRIDYLKQISGKWYKLHQYLIAGHYAAEVAEMEPSAEAWSIAGTTYLAGIANQDPLLKSGSFQGAVYAIENAISLDPDNIDHRINLAVAYTESPPEENPMKGIQMLLSLNGKHPDNLPVLTTLGRLAIKTGQLEKAQKRLERAVEIDPEYSRAVCLLAEVYRQTADSRATEQASRCELINK